MLIIGTGGCFAQPKAPCLAFLLKADVIVLCQGKATRITHRRDIENFAISEEHSSLAFVCHRVLRPNRDVATGEDVTFAPYVRFRCSADRQVVVGITRDGATKGQRSDLYMGVPPATRIASAGDVHAHNFNVSPDGSKIVYFNDSRPLCLRSGHGPAQCVQHATIADTGSVNDSGEVLVATGTGRGCVYRTPSDFAPAASGLDGDDECLGIGYWTPGMKSVAIIVPRGRNPQWISPRMAGALRHWSVASIQSAHK